LKRRQHVEDAGLAGGDLFGERLVFQDFDGLELFLSRTAEYGVQEAEELDLISFFTPLNNRTRSV